jgi:hypothetical protein
VPFERPDPLLDAFRAEPLREDALPRDEDLPDPALDPPAPADPLREGLRFLEDCEVATDHNVTDQP